MMLLIQLYPFLLLNWNSLIGFNCKYLINKNGYLTCLQKKGLNKFLKSRIDRAGYFTVRLNKNGQSSTHYVHRLLAIAVIPNANNKPFINHINGIKTDNRIENLEWITHAENVQHAYKMGLCKLENRQTPIIDICSGKKFPSIKKAAEFNLIKYNTCKGYLNGSRPNPTCLRYLSTEVA
jgi:hypothetical protein